MDFEEGNSHFCVAKLSMVNEVNRFVKKIVCSTLVIPIKIDKSRRYTHGTTTRSTCTRCGLRIFYLLGEPKDLNDASTLNKQRVVSGWKMYWQYILSDSIRISQPACLPFF